MTNTVSNASFKYTGSSTAPEVKNEATEEITEEQAKEAQEKKEKTKAEVEKKLSETPIRFGMVANPIETGKTAASASATVPIGQPQAKTIDRFSVDQICADIDGYEEVQDDSGIKSLISSFMGRFTGSTAAKVNSTEAQQLPAYSEGGLLDLPKEVQMTPEAIEALKTAGTWDTMQNLSQTNSTDKTQAEQVQEKTESLGRMQEILQKMNDPNVSPEEKAKLMAEAQNLFTSTPQAQSSLPAGVVNTSAKVAENMSPQEIEQAMSFVQSHSTGIDDEDPEFKALPQNVQTYIKSVASDAAKNEQNGVKPADYKMPNEVTE